MFRNPMRGTAALVGFALLATPATPQCENRLVGHAAQEDGMQGFSVAAFGDLVAVGAPFEGPGEIKNGRVYLFASGTDGWTQVDHLEGKNASEAFWFGHSVAMISESVVVAGAPRSLVGGESQGAVYIFEFDGQVWEQVQRLTPGDDGSLYGLFGHVVAADGDTIVVGAPQEDEAGGNSGALYVFEKGASSWDLTQKLLPEGLGVGYRLPTSLDIHGDVLIAGASKTLDLPGYAYIYERNAGVWELSATLSPNGTEEEPEFGSSVAVEGSWAAVSARQDEEPEWVEGSIYTYQRTDAGWVLDEKFIYDAGPDDHGWFGWSIALDAGRLAVSKLDWDGDGLGYTGEVQLFERSDPDGWQVVGAYASSSDDEDSIGTSIDLCGQVLVAGAPDAEDGGEHAGAAYVFDFAQASQKVYCTSTLNSTGSAATLHAEGPLSLQSNQVDLVASDCPPNQFGYFIFGKKSASLPIGNGVLCIDPAAPGLHRVLPVEKIDQAGTARVWMNMEDPVFWVLTSDTNWRFQFWFRDPAAGGAGFNFSHGVVIRFCP